MCSVAFLRRRRRRCGLGLVGLDLRLTLLAFEPVDRIPQPLNLSLRFPLPGNQLLDQVQQPLNQDPRIFVVNGVKINVF